MADATTTTYGFTKPEVGASEDSWGGKLNGNWDDVDDLFDGTTVVTGISMDDTMSIVDNADNTKVLQLQLSGITTATTRTLTVPDASDTLALLAATQTFTNKTLTNPTVAAATVTGTVDASGATFSDLGSVTTADINGGTIDGVTIGGSSAGAGTFTTATMTTLNDGTNGVAATYITGGSAKAWAHVDFAGTNTINQSMNISSLTDRAGGRPTLNLTSALAYTCEQAALSGSCDNYTFVRYAATYATASAVDIILSSDAGGAEDADFGASIDGDLA